MASFISLTDLVYPVGAFYISNSSTSPASLFGGSWTQVTGRYLYAATWAGTGGSYEHYHDYGIGLYTSAAALIGGNGNNLYAYDGSTYSWTPTTLVSEYKTGVWNKSAQDYTASHSGQMARVFANTTPADNSPAYRACYVWYRTS